MKEYKKNLIINLSIGLIITYLAGWSDIYKNGWITGNVIKDFQFHQCLPEARRGH
jgi:hypothetical protein